MGVHTQMAEEAATTVMLQNSHKTGTGLPHSLKGLFLHRTIHLLTSHLPTVTVQADGVMPTWKTRLLTTTSLHKERRGLEILPSTLKTTAVVMVLKMDTTLKKIHPHIMATTPLLPCHSPRIPLCMLATGTGRFALGCHMLWKQQVRHTVESLE